ncbi:MAG: UDP-N-acetylmuramate--L-alanine ligase, partial [Bacteroidetes bacterium]|nr:UDP-N-acetylmuramate--L-alanine ligase [Bacteroidota bacterium]
PGVYRRLNVFKWKGAWLIDDYAHHPTEIKSVLETVQSFFAEQKKCVVFQPHLFSRTQDFYKEFIEVLSQFDEVVLMEIYPAREEPIEGISSKNLLKDLNHPNKKLIEKTQLAQTIEASEATVFAFLGAGDIGEQIQFLKSKIEVE